MTTEPAETPMPIMEQVHREVVRESLGGIIATLTAELDGADAVSDAAADPDHRLYQAITDRDMIIGADPETLTRIEQRWGLADTAG